MKKRADGQATPAAEVCSLDKARKAVQKIIEAYDATALIGLKVIVRHAAIETGCGEDATIELPKLDELMATVAVTRCLMPERLRGWEVKAMRKIMRMTLADMAQKLDEKTAIETVSRWENDAQPMGGYAEKVLRLLVCDTLSEKAPGVSYSDGMISRLKQIDPWRVRPDYELPPIEVGLVKIVSKTGVDNGWTAEAA